MFLLSFVSGQLLDLQALEALGLKLTESQLQPLRDRLQVDQSGAVTSGGEESQVDQIVTYNKYKNLCFFVL